jgi:hypothetical protein
MPSNGIVGRCMGMDIWACRCGARYNVVEVWELGNPDPSYIPTERLEECQCPKCITCGWVIDEEGRCDNLDCALLGVLILLPD